MVQETLSGPSQRTCWTPYSRLGCTCSTLPAMTSLSVTPMPAGHLSPFDSGSNLGPSTSTDHTRKHSRAHSRNASAAPLPAFSFNPGAASGSGETEHSESIPSIPDEMPANTAPRRAQRPPPLPDFSFNPGADLPLDPSPSPTHPILEEMAANQQRVSRSARQAPLPIFSFAPGSTTTPERSPSPTKSGFGDVSGSLRTSRRGHQRQGSEFVGGGVDGNQLISTSPGKSEVRSQGPPVTTLNSRSHQHRRSQAISISEIDTSELIKANAIAKHRAESTPTTPSEAPPAFSSHSPQHQSMSYAPTTSPPTSPRRRGSAPGIRARVGFSETIDVIPRPLSLISSETDGSTSTIRGNHSLSGSINSIATSPNPRLSWAAEQSFSSSIGSDISPRRRPVTADPTTFGQGRSVAQESVIVNLPKRPLSASGSPAVPNSGSPPTKKKHFWFSNSAETSPSPTPKIEKKDPIADMPAFYPSLGNDLTRPKTSPERSASIKKRKVVKSWTHGIFSRKGRSRSMKVKPKRTPTPPLSRRASDHLNEIFDEDNTVVIQNSPSPIQRRGSAPASQLLTSQIIPQYPVGHERMTSPIIDLDAALGPFGSEEKLSDSTSRAPAARMAKLHSAERRGLTDAFGTFHRRAESAPAMPPMNRPIFGFQNMESNVSLSQDVFDEEEEDNFLATEGAGASSVNSKDDSSHSPEASPEPETPAKRESVGQNSSCGGLGLSVSSSAPDGVVIVDSEDESAPQRARSSNSTLEAPILRDADLPKRPATSPMPMEFAYSAPRTNYASSTEGRTATNSLISSPDPEHVSFDEQPRFNRYLGEPSPEFGVRASTDDLPSLTDSVSTSGLPRVSSSANTRNSVDQRSISVSNPSVPKQHNAWKRASLASLNRLIPGSSNGSKLKFETVAEPAEEEKIRKKSNRLSKLMHFWRSKERGEK